MFVNNTFFIWSQFPCISSVSTVSFCFQGNHISKVWCHFGGWNTLEAFEVKNTHKFSTAGFFNKQRESDLTICIQIGPSLLQYQLLKTHFCLTVGFLGALKIQLFTLLMETSASQPRGAQDFYCHTIHKGFVLVFFWSLIFDFFFFLRTFPPLYLSAGYLCISQCLGTWACLLCRKTHTVLFWLRNELK